MPGGREQHQEVLRVRGGDGGHFDVLRDEEELVARQRREGQAHAGVQDLAEEVAGGGSQLLRVNVAREGDGRPLDGGGHGGHRVLEQGGEARVDGGALRLALWLLGHADRAFFFLLLRSLQRLVHLAQQRRVVQVQRLQAHAQRGVGLRVVEHGAHLPQRAVQLHEQVVLGTGALRLIRRSGTHAQETSGLRLEGGGGAVGRVDVGVDGVAEAGVLVGGQRRLVHRDEGVDVQQVDEQHAQHKGVVRGLDRLEEGAETPDHRVVVNYLQRGEEEKRAKLGVKERRKCDAEAAGNVGATLHVVEHGVDECGHHTLSEGRVQTADELDDDAVNRRLGGLLRNARNEGKRRQRP